MEIRGKSVADVANKALEATLRRGTLVERIIGPWAMHGRIEKHLMHELHNVTLVVQNPTQRWNTRVGEGMCQDFLDYYLGLNPGYVHLTQWAFYARWIDRGTRQYPYTYGERIFGSNAEKINQWKLCVRKLKRDVTTRQASIVIWRPLDLRRNFVPCALQWHFQKNEENELEMTSMIRSQDALHGLFLDLFAYTHFHEIMATEINLPVGPYTQFETNLHIYQKDVKSAREALAKDPPSYTRAETKMSLHPRCKPLTEGGKGLMQRALKALYADRNLRQFTRLTGRLQDYWRSYLLFQFLDNPKNRPSRIEDSSLWMDSYRMLEPDMLWVLRERARLRSGRILRASTPKG